MGLFDELTCRMALPGVGVTDTLFQTKSLPAMYMEHYELRADGTLWHEEYDIEDRSDPDAKGVESLRGAMSRVNLRWEPASFTGEIYFYEAGNTFSVVIVRGKVDGVIQRVAGGV